MRVECRADSPNRKTLSRDAGRLQNALLRGTKAVKLKFDHLLQCFRDTGVDIVKRLGQRPSFVFARNEPVLHESLHHRRHKQGISIGLAMDQAGEGLSKVTVRKFAMQIVSNINFFQSVQSDLPAKMMN